MKSPRSNVFALTALASVMLVTGCAPFSSSQMANAVRQESRATTNALMAQNRRVVENRVVDSSYISGAIVDYVDPGKGSVSMNVSQQQLYSVFRSLADQAGYASSISSDVDPKKLVSVDIRKATHEQAMRDIASAAGYVVVFNHNKKTATLTDSAVYTFRLPSRLFNDSLASKYKMSNSPGGGSTSGAGAMATSADASVDGGSIKTSAQGFAKTVKDMAGSDSDVQVLPDSGLITVRSKAQQLRRINEFLTDYARFALTQVELEVSMLEISLGDDMSTGVNWKKLLTVAGAPLNISLNTAGNVTGSALSISYTNASVDTLVNLLQKNTNARTLARHRIPAFNNTLALMFDGKKVPYIGKIDSNVSGTSGTTTTTGEFTYAMDGISTAVYTNVLNNDMAELTLMPVLSSIEGFETQVISGNTIRAPIAPLRQGHYPFIGRNGQTLIFGGGRYGKDSAQATGMPLLASTPLNRLAGSNVDSKMQKELIYLVSTKIIPMSKFEPLIRESL